MDSAPVLYSATYYMGPTRTQLEITLLASSPQATKTDATGDATYTQTVSFETGPLHYYRWAY